VEKNVLLLLHFLRQEKKEIKEGSEAKTGVENGIK